MKPLIAPMRWMIPLSLTDIAEVKIKRSIQSGGPYTLLTPTALPGTETMFIDTAVAPGTAYFYVVKFIHNEPDCRNPGQVVSYQSPFSNEVTASTCCPDPEGEFWTDDTPSAQQLAEWIMAGSGIAVVPNSATYTGAPMAKGIFGNGFNADLPLGKGVILSSGDIALAKGPNDESAAGMIHNRLGDENLDYVIFPYTDYTTHDAAVLEFEVLSSVATNIVFKYVFASEEYPEYQNSYDDVAAIFVDNVNVALVSATIEPVSIFTINSVNNSQYYEDNPLNSPVFNIQYNGLTTLLTAEAEISANVPHYIKIAIADTRDWQLDSAVFIKAQIPCP